MKTTRSKEKGLLDGMFDAAIACGDVLMRHFGKTLEVHEKARAGLVSNADLESEKTAIKILKKVRPDFSFLAEESGVTQKKHLESGRWIIDPLDGTTNYVHAFPMFCVSIAAEVKGEVVAGIVYHPPLKDLFYAIKGKGTYRNGKRVYVSESKKLKTTLLSTGFSYHAPEWLRSEMNTFENVSHAAGAIRRPGAAALDLAYVSCGIFDGFWERNLSPWDVAAGSLLVTEAGGKVTNFKGKTSLIDDREILASNGLIHNSMLRKIRKEN